MNTSDLLKKVRKVEIKTKGLSTQLFSGEYHSAFKGRGMAFSEVREYQAGDEIRTIDWNVTARFGDPYVKVFEEEREMTVMILVDVSGSKQYGSTEQSKQQMATELAATIAFSAIQNNDKVGVIFFSDKVEKYIPPKKGKSHILQIIRFLLDFEPESLMTDVSVGLKFLTSVLKKRSTAFLISDFMCKSSFDDMLKYAKRKHDLLALEVYDPNEVNLPNVGVLPVQDIETGETNWISTSSKKVRQIYTDIAVSRKESLHELFKKSGVDFAEIATNDDYVKKLMQMFNKRIKK